MNKYLNNKILKKLKLKKNKNIIKVKEIKILL